MKTEITNPFITGGYAGPEYFCNREDETKRLAVPLTREGILPWYLSGGWVKRDCSGT
jgi:hypothetical protein